MTNVRRGYIFLVCAISLQGVTWAVIELLRDLFAPFPWEYGPAGSTPAATAYAFPIAVIIVGLPVFLAHWLWARRLARQDVEERGAVLRRLYLYGMLAGFLVPLAINVFNVLIIPLRSVFEVQRYSYSRYELTPGRALLHDLLAALILGALWFYHWRVVVEDAAVVPETGLSAVIRQIYVFAFSGGGLAVMTFGVVQLLRWVLSVFGERFSVAGEVELAHDIPRVIVGTVLWVVFWRWAQRLFAGPRREERRSVLRKVYLYLAVFAGVLGFVSTVALLLRSFLSRWLGVAGRGGEDLGVALSMIVCTAVLWAYHGIVLRGDTAVVEEAPQQALVRQIYFYLVATVGLAAVLVGLSGDVSVLIRSLADGFTADLKQQLSLFSAMLIAGLPVWVVSWRKVQREAEAPGDEGAEERRSVVRKAYLYFYLFAATITILSGTIAIVYQLLRLVLGAELQGNLLSVLGQPLAFALIAGGVLLYHGTILRQDQRWAERDRAERLLALRVVVVDAAEGHLGRAILDELARKLPHLVLQPVGLTVAAAGAMGVPAAAPAAPDLLAEADLIVGPWYMAVPGGGGVVSEQFATAIGTSPARRLLLPVGLAGWEWVGVERGDEEELVRQVTQAAEQIAEGAEVRQRRPLSVGAIIGIVIAVLVILVFLMGPLIDFLVGTL